MFFSKKSREERKQKKILKKENKINENIKNVDEVDNEILVAYSENNTTLNSINTDSQKINDFQDHTGYCDLGNEYDNLENKNNKISLSEMDFDTHTSEINFVNCEKENEDKIIISKKNFNMNGEKNMTNEDLKVATKKPRNIYYVSARKDKDGKLEGWEVKKEKANKITKLCQTKEEAIDLVKALAGNQGSTCIIRKKDGSIQQTIKFSKEK